MPVKPLDERDLNERLQRALGGRVVAPVTPLTGGASSLTFWTTMDGDSKIVVKVSPPGLEPVRNRDMLRQARVHKALEGSPVPVPTVLATDAGDPPDVPPFFVMDFVPGECVELAFLAPGDSRPPEVIRGRLMACANLMGKLHRVDPEAIGLGDEPVTGLTQEVQRWKDSLDVCDEDLKSGTDDVYERLLATVPTAEASSLLHGDLRTGNVLAEDDRVTSLIDWEIWSRGDPRTDLAWFLVFIEDARREHPPGTPSVAELVDAYEEARGAPVEGLDWFRALVRYKQTATGAFITRNARRRGAEVVPVDNSTSWLLQSARELLA